MQENPARTDAFPPAGSRQVQAQRLQTGGATGASAPAVCHVPVEAPLTLDVVGVGSYTVMCTPRDTRALAVGFLFAERIIDRLADIAVLQQCPEDPGVLRIQLQDPARATGRARNLIVVSSCGLCGSRTLAEVLAALSPVGNGFRIPAVLLRDLPEAMRSAQQLYRVTGGTHAAAIFDNPGTILALGEDVGRHSALDKAVGTCLLQKIPFRGRGVVLSGRVSLEILLKCARAGLELIVAVSSPTSLAIEVAERCNITVCGFVRGDQATVYTRPQRLAWPDRPGSG